MKKYFSFVKIEHTVFSLPVIYAGMTLAVLASHQEGTAHFETSWLIKIGLLILAAATGARTVGFALNRIIDRVIDAKNPRTAMRDLPSGRMTLKQGYIVMVAGLALYLWSAWNINTLCFILSPIPLVVFVLYPFMKRFTIFAHFGVGLSLALGPLGGYLAVRPVYDEYMLPVILLTVFTWLWVSGFDIIYSTSDEEFDKREGLFSFPSRFGRKKALIYAALTHFISFLFLTGVYFTAFQGSIVGAILLFVTAILLYVEHKKVDNVELAFFHINTVVGFVVFAYIFASSYLLMK